MARTTQLSVGPKDGGRLITVQSPDNVGVENYVEKTNLRRLDDAEVRRHGTISVASAASEPILGMWEVTRPNGERAIVAAGATKIFKLSVGAWSQIGSGFTATQWDAVEIDGYLIFNNTVDLPVYFRVEDASVTPMYELRETGIASIGVIAVYNGFLMIADITEIADGSLATVMNGVAPYGLVSSGITNRIRYKIAQSDYGQPTNWSPVLNGTIESASRNQVTLEWASQVFQVGDKLAVIGAGPGGGTLGGQTNTPDGVAITAIVDDLITLEDSADISLTYPLAVQVTRFADTSSFVGSSSIQDDSSAIIRMLPLKSVLVVYRESSIWTGRYTANVDSPFIFSLAYRGPDVPAYPLAIAGVDGDYHVYPTRNGFRMFDNAGAPRVHGPLDDARTLFFDNVGTKPFALDNPLTHEIWFFNSAGVLAFDYRWNTVSWQNESYTAAAYVRDPSDSTLFRFFLAKNTAAYRTSETTWLRASGASNLPALTGGYASLRDDIDQKEWRRYGLLLASGCPSIEVTVTLKGTDGTAASEDTLLTEVMDDPVLNPLIEVFYRNIYLQDRIQVTDDSDSDFRLAGRTFTFRPVATRGGSLSGNP